MAKIRDLALFDVPKIKKLMSFVNADINTFFDGLIIPYPLNLPLKLLPMRFKFLPESYVLTDKNKILACVNVKNFHRNYKKWEISRLLMSENPYETGLLLLQYVITKFAAKGIHTFLATIDESQVDLINLFTNGAGFRQCSRQQLWKCTNINTQNNTLIGLCVRPFKNSDANKVAELFNESILPHFRPSLSRSKREFYEPHLNILSHSSEFRYIIENTEKKQIVSYIVLKTNDNTNFTMDFIISKAYENLFPELLNYTFNQAKKRTKDLNFYVVNRYYLQTAGFVEAILKDHKYEASNSSAILVKDLFKTIKNENSLQQAVFYSNMNSNPAFDSIH